MVADRRELRVSAEPLGALVAVAHGAVEIVQRLVRLAENRVRLGGNQGAGIKHRGVLEDLRVQFRESFSLSTFRATWRSSSVSRAR